MATSYCRPIELLQEYKHGARHSRLEGTEARKGGKKEQKRAFHLRWMKRKHNLLNRVISLRAGITASARNLQCMRDVADFLYLCFLFIFVRGQKTGAVATMEAFSVDDCRRPAASSQIQGSSAGRTGIIPPFTAPFLCKKNTDLPLLYSPSPLVLAEPSRRRWRRRREGEGGSLSWEF